jgi:hypothetical protein
MPARALVSLVILFVCSAAAHAEGPAAPGWADLHVHQMAGLAFGGKYLWGSHQGPSADALRPCSGHSLDGHGFGAGTEGGTGNLKTHGRGGHPDYAGWPRWDTTSHQQVHADWLKKAHEAGLTLTVMPAVNQDDYWVVIKFGSTRMSTSRACRSRSARKRWPSRFARCATPSRGSSVRCATTGWRGRGAGGTRPAVKDTHALHFRAVFGSHVGSFDRDVDGEYAHETGR